MENDIVVKIDNKNVEYMKNLALDFTTTATSTAAVVTGVLGVSFIYQKFLNRSVARHSKKNPVQPES